MKTRYRFDKKLLSSSLFILYSSTVAAQTLVSAPAAQNFGNLALSSSGTVQTLGFTFSGAASAPTFSLAYGLDYVIRTQYCTGSGNVSCTISVSFLPRLAGLRKDALLAKGSAGAVVATTALYGVGLGAQTAVFPGVISTVVGTSVWGYSGDGGPATSAKLRAPQGLAFDNFGNLYIADSVNQVIRKVTALTGAISTVAGNGNYGYSGDGGPATSATLASPAGVAVDGAGNLFIADQGNDVIRRVDAVTRKISTVAGGGAGASRTDGLGDGGLAVNALLYGPNDVALDGAGNLYIADSLNGLVREVSAATGLISVVAGGGSGGGADGLGDGGPATQASLNNPLALALDNAGNLYIADSGHSMVRRVDASSGVIRAVAGTGAFGYSGDLGSAVSAMLAKPSGIRLDAAGNLYISDTGKQVIREVNGTSGIITTIAGVSARRYSGDGGVPTGAGVADPAGLALDAKGNLYIADLSNNVVRFINWQPTPLSFANTLVGQASPPSVISILNNGNQPLRFSGLTIPPNFIQGAYNGFDCSASSVVPVGSSCTLSLQFAPTQAGILSGVLSFTTNTSSGSGGVQTMVLSGTAAIGAVPSVALSAATWRFGAQTLGTASAAKSFLLTNVGNAGLQIYSLAINGLNGGDFAVSTSCPSVVAAGASCFLSVVFTPHAQGDRAAFLAIADNAANAGQMIALSGTGTQVPQVALNQSALSFGSRVVGATSPMRTVTLSNVGSGQLNIVSLALSGANASDFTVSTGCGSIVAEKNACPIAIGFSPKAPGARSATVVLTSNAMSVQQTIALVGTGVAKTMPAVWRPQTGTWYMVGAGSNSMASYGWGARGDIPAPADFDGDGIVDLAVFRPSTGIWYIIPSATWIPKSVGWGVAGDVPVPADYDGDGKADVALFRPSSGVWYIIPSSTGVPRSVGWGMPGDIPVVGDYDGDGKADVALFRPSSSVWYIIPSSTGVPRSVGWGMPGDIPVAGDYDGDGQTDVAIYRPSNGVWYIVLSTTGGTRMVGWGVAGDVPVPGDYDGDGKMDVAAYRPSAGMWYIVPSSTGSYYGVGNGSPGDILVQGAYGR